MAQGIQLIGARHASDHFFTAQLIFVPDTQSLTAFEDDEPVANDISMVRIVGDEDDSQASRPGQSDVAQHRAGLLNAQGSRRLIENQDLGSEIDCSRNGHRLAFTTGHGAHGLIGIADVNPHLTEFLAHGAFGKIDVIALERSKFLFRLGAEKKVTPDRHQGNQG